MTVRQQRVAMLAALYGATVVFLNAVPGPWQRYPKGEAVDAWTGTHVFWGVVAARMGISFEDLMALSVANEGMEAFLRRTWPSLTFGTPETMPNVVADLAANAVGWQIGNRYR